MTETAGPNGQRPLIDRDLSWLQFNERVLSEAKQPENPILERAKFLGISSSNLDEFFMIRFASLSRSLSRAVQRGENLAVKHFQKIHSLVVREVEVLGIKQDRILRQLIRDLKPHGIHLHRRWDKDPMGAELGRKLFQEKILPELAAPEPFSPKKLQSLMNFQLAAVFPSVWWAVPKKIPPTFVVESESGAAHVYFLDELLADFLGTTFGIQEPPAIVRLTRDGDVSLGADQENSESIPDAVRTGIGNRERARVVRLQYTGTCPPELLEQFARTFRLEEKLVFRAPQSLSLHGLWGTIGKLPEKIRNEKALSYPVKEPRIPDVFTGSRSLFDVLKERDLLLHHPYDSFDAFLQWIREACADPAVTEIDITVYRTDSVSPVLAELKAAAKSKLIRVVIELRARFDELNNLRFAEELRTAGVEVSYGFGKLKLHAKVALVTRTENGEPRRYTHLSTGNYHAVTARQYTDLAILTAHPGIGADARHFFDAVRKEEVPTSFSTLVTAPTKLHRRILHHIEEEIQAAHKGKKARIFAKLNSLVDEAVIDHLYRASSAGVEVDLVVRGACSLIPGIKGVSENIRVVSIVDRYLEHSRIYFFENSDVIYLSSADWMPRNFFSRLEIAFPVLDQRIYSYIKDVVIPTYLSDSVRARELTPAGSWRSRNASAQQKPLRSQFYFQDLAARGYRGTVLDGK